MAGGADLASNIVGDAMHRGVIGCAPALCTGAISEFAAKDIAIAPVVVDPADLLEHAVHLMNESATTHLVVAHPATKRAVGVLSMLDVAGVLAEGGAR